MADATAQGAQPRDRVRSDGDQEHGDTDASRARRRVAEHYLAMARRGVEQRGAGRIE